MIPIEINHYPVVAYAPLGKPDPGNDIGFVIVDRGAQTVFDGKPFVTWLVCYAEKYGWFAFNGHYDLDWDDAIVDFKHRAG